jgi:large subunit ribosomal protein L4
MQVSLRQFEDQHSSSELPVSDQVFGRRFNETLVHQIVTSYLAKGRQGTKAQKTRAEVRGGGRKPWKQKGTGRARAGTIRSPLWRKGGVVFAATPRDHSKKVNKKMYRAAICSMLSELNRKNRLQVFDFFDVQSSKTKELVDILKKLNLNDALIVTENFNENLTLAARNIPNICVCHVGEVNPSLLIYYDNVVFTAPALQKLESSLRNQKDDS